MRKDQIEATKQKAIKLLQENISKQQKNGFWGFMAQELGVTQAVITRIKDGTRPLTLERAMQIIEAVPRILKLLKNK